jgi:acetyltransferase
MGVENLDKIFKPKSIAVIGASNKSGSAGYRIFRNLIGSGYEGIVFPVNPNYESIQGVQTYSKVADLPKIVDLAIIATPAKIVPDVIDQCGKKGIKGILIISAGFKEIGEEGIALEKKIVDIKKKYGLRIVGPNCVGITLPYLNLNATFTSSIPEKGNIALFSQSGAICGAILDWAESAKVGFSAFVSVGSMLDVDFGDLIDYFGMDMYTRSILLYVESITDAKKFMSAAKSFARIKPIVVIKSGRFKEGAKAASSHTGALAGEDAIYDAAFKRAGVVRVLEIEDLFYCSSILAKQPRPTGPNLAIITNAGGPGVLATDAIIEDGGKLAEISEETMTKLNQILPQYWSKGNPIDILGDADEDKYVKVINICLEDKKIDGIIVVCVPQVMTSPRLLAEKMLELAKKSTKPLLAAIMGEESVNYARQILNRNNIPAYPTPEEAVKAYMHLYHYARNLALIFETPEEINIEASEKNKDKLKKIIDNSLKENRVLLNEFEAKEFLKFYNINTTQTFIAKNEDEAVKHANKIGYPIVMKILSPQIAHKSDVGGVALDLQCDKDVKIKFKEMIKKAKEKVPDAKIQGVTIQNMVKNKGYELILGSKKDPLFGSVILFGMGGIYTELFKDKNIGFPPVNQVISRRIIEKTKAYQLLKGFRGLPAVDIQKVEELMGKFSQLIIDNPYIKEIDINPLMASPEEIIAVDARIELDPNPEKHPHIIITPYPTKYIKTIKLKDGTEVLFRPIKPEDEYLWLDMFQSFSDETVRFRFFRLIKDTPHEMRTRYCNIDYDREIGIVAEIKENGKRKLIGVTRLILKPGSTDEAEYALVVSDKWHRLGLGSEFIDYTIEIAKDKKMKKLYGIVLKDNSPMVTLCREKNFIFKPGDPGEYAVEYPLK